MEERPRTIHGYSIYRMVIYTKLQFGRLLFKETPEAFYHDLPLSTESHCFAWQSTGHLKSKPEPRTSAVTMPLSHRNLKERWQWKGSRLVGFWPSWSEWWLGKHMGVKSRLGTPKKIHQKWLSSVGNQCLFFKWPLFGDTTHIAIIYVYRTVHIIHIHTMIWMIASKCQKH